MISNFRYNNKTETNPLIIQQNFAEIKADYSDCFSTVYTDGLKDVNRVVIVNIKATFRLQAAASINTAKAKARILALKFIAT